MNMKITDFYVIEYSVEQNSHHVRTVADMLKNNHANVEKRISKDFVPVCFTSTREQAVALSQRLGKFIDTHVSSGRELSEKLGLVFSVSDCEEADSEESEP